MKTTWQVLDSGRNSSGVAWEIRKMNYDYVDRYEVVTGGQVFEYTDSDSCYDFLIENNVMPFRVTTTDGKKSYSHEVTIDAPTEITTRDEKEALAQDIANRLRADGRQPTLGNV